ncbi:MAG: DnaJ domain-containing protein [Anaeromyxobacter sp.]
MAAREVGAEAAIAAGLPLVGALDQASTLRLLGLAAAAGASGRLSLSAEGRTYALTFRRGAVEHVVSSEPADDLGRWLLRKGVLTPESLVQVEAVRASAGGDMGTALITSGRVNPADVAGLLAEHGAALVLRALALEAGAFSWEPNVPPPPSSFPLGAPFAALVAAVRSLDLAALQRRLGDRERRVASRMAGRVRPEDLRLAPQEARAAAQFDGLRSPAEIAAAAPAEAATVLRLALLLGEVDLLAFGPEHAPRPAAPAAAPAPVVTPPPVAPAAPAASAAPAAAPAPPPVAARPEVPTPPPVAARPAVPTPPPAPRPAVTTPPPAPRPPATTPPPAPRPPPAQAAPRPPPAAPRPPPAAPPPAAAAVTTLDPAALRALLEKVRAADHFDVLGVKRDAQVAAIKIAYFKLAKTYHPDTVPAGAPPEVKKLCADIFARVGEAWGVLGDDAQRAAYVQELQAGGKPDVDVMAILQAENIFGAGTLLVKSRRYDEARAKFEEALKLNPDEAEFAMWKAWCDFLLAPAGDRKGVHRTCAAVIEAGLKKNPRCAPGYLFLGQMAKLENDPAAAEKHYKRGLQVVPDDPELTRELKYLKR